MKIYFAAPLFTQAERIWNDQLAAELASFGYDVFLPQADSPQNATSSTIFAADRDGVRDADTVLAIMDGADPDSGTCWECGYAYGLGIPVVTVRTDFRGAGDFGGRFNLMLSEGAQGSVEVVDSLSIEELATLIVGVLSNLAHTKTED